MQMVINLSLKSAELKVKLALVFGGALFSSKSRGQ